MAGCYDKVRQLVLRRRSAAHRRMRQYCGRVRTVAVSSLMALTFVAMSHGHARAQSAPDDTPWKGEEGAASFYGKAHQGRRTASGTRFDMKALTAAHPWLPFGTKVLVQVEGTGRAVVVTITDRLYSARRIIDLSREAAAQLGILRQGIAYVSLSPAS